MLNLGRPGSLFWRRQERSGSSYAKASNGSPIFSWSPFPQAIK